MGEVKTPRKVQHEHAETEPLRNVERQSKKRKGRVPRTTDEEQHAATAHGGSRERQFKKRKCRVPNTDDKRTESAAGRYGERESKKRKGAPSTDEEHANSATGRNGERQSKKRKGRVPNRDDKRTEAATDRNGERQSKKRKGRVPSTDDDDDEHNVRSPREVWSKSKKKRMRKLLAKQRNNGELPPGGGGKDSTTQPEQPARLKDEGETKTKQLPDEATKDYSSSSQATSSSSSLLRESFVARLSGSRFRALNEELYTTTSLSTYARFQADPALYEQYHEGYRKQVESWPVNPLHLIIQSLKSLANAAASGEKLVVADFGCGDAVLAQELLKTKSNTAGQHHRCPFEVHSFDLVAHNDLVTACDMAHVPLGPSSVDIAVFCLSLMGTNLADFIREAHRVLKTTGMVKIAEVRSRFFLSSIGSGGMGPRDELKEFIQVLNQLGFDCTKTDQSNKMFVLLDLKLNGKNPVPTVSYTAKPCVYKKR